MTLSHTYRSFLASVRWKKKSRAVESRACRNDRKDPVRHRCFLVHVVLCLKWPSELGNWMARWRAAALASIDRRSVEN